MEALNVGAGGGSNSQHAYPLTTCTSTIKSTLPRPCSNYEGHSFGRHRSGRPGLDNNFVDTNSHRLRFTADADKAAGTGLAD